MDDFGSFVYLDVQKTGSSFISDFLQANSKSKRVKFVKHGRIEDDLRRDATYFISARNPVDQYISLFQFGCEKKGGLFFELRDRGLADLYENSNKGFERWLDFMLSSKNAPLLGEDYQFVDTDLIGFQSFRFLTLSLQHPISRLSKVKNYRELLRLYKANKIHDYIIRNESLVEDLKKLVEAHLDEHIDIMQASEYLSNAQRVNYSQKLNIDIKSISKNTINKLLSKEEFLLRNFYPDYMSYLKGGKSTVSFKNILPKFRLARKV